MGQMMNYYTWQVSKKRKVADKVDGWDQGKLLACPWKSYELLLKTGQDGEHLSNTCLHSLAHPVNRN